MFSVNNKLSDKRWRRRGELPIPHSAKGQKSVVHLTKLYQISWKISSSVKETRSRKPRRNFNKFYEKRTIPLGTPRLDLHLLYSPNRKVIELSPLSVSQSVLGILFPLRLSCDWLNWFGIFEANMTLLDDGVLLCRQHEMIAWAAVPAVPWRLRVASTNKYAPRIFDSVEFPFANDTGTTNWIQGKW